jgi:hypothetical protein
MCFLFVFFSGDLHHEVRMEPSEGGGAVESKDHFRLQRIVAPSPLVASQCDAALKASVSFVTRRSKNHWHDSLSVTRDASPSAVSASRATLHLQRFQARVDFKMRRRFADFCVRSSKVRFLPKLKKKRNSFQLPTEQLPLENIRIKSRLIEDSRKSWRAKRLEKRDYTIRKINLFIAFDTKRRLAGFGGKRRELKNWFISFSCAASRRRKPATTLINHLGSYVQGLRSFVDIQITDRQNVDIQIVDTEM